MNGFLIAVWGKGLKRRPFPTPPSPLRIENS
jgi:hypothetical protein